MDKEELLEKTVELLQPLETQNLMETVQHLTMQELFANWILWAIALPLIIYGVFKKSKTILLTIFFLFVLIVVVKFAMPVPGEEMSLKSIIPFMAVGVGAGSIIVYFMFVKD